MRARCCPCRCSDWTPTTAASSSTPICSPIASASRSPSRAAGSPRRTTSAYVEQKNGAIVRQLVGYDRFEGEHAYRQLAELYRAVRLYVNFFQPSMKLRLKERAGGKLRRRYDPAKTPFQRLLTAGVLSTPDRVRLTGIAQALDPVQLLRQIELELTRFRGHLIIGQSML